jgi:hypothetical protein
MTDALQLEADNRKDRLLLLVECITSLSSLTHVNNMCIFGRKMTDNHSFISCTLKNQVP